MSFWIVEIVIMGHPDVQISLQQKALVLRYLFPQELVQDSGAHGLYLRILFYKRTDLDLNLALFVHFEFILLNVDLVNIILLLSRIFDLSFL